MPFIQFQHRRDTASAWVTNNPLLASGEMGLETDTSLFKIGNGATGWNGLSYGGLKGPTGPTGSTNFSGPTGSVLFSPDGKSITGSEIMTFNANTGYPGYQGMLNITGNLKVAGGIDPIFLQLTATTSNPYPSGIGILWYNSLLNSLMVDNLALNGMSYTGASGPTGTTTTTTTAGPTTTTTAGPTTTTTAGPTTTTTTTLANSSLGVTGYINVSTLAGSSQGYFDGTGTAGRFSAPNGITTDSSGNLYVVDKSNQRIRKITPSGLVSTFAGSGSQGSGDGQGTAAQFNNPEGITIDSSGNLYITDSGNQRIRKITSSGAVSTLAGSGVQGNADGSGGVATFNVPTGITIDSSGNLYVCNSTGNTIRKITSSGVVSTFAGSGVQGNADGQGTAAQFNNPRSIAIDSSGNLYVCDTSNYRVRKITSSGLVSTFAGSISGNVNSQGTAARFGDLVGITIDSNGNLYVCDSSNFCVKQITSGGMVSTVVGTISGNVDGLLANSKFNALGQITRDTSNNLYLSDSGNHTIRKITTGYTGVLGKFSFPTNIQYSRYTLSGEQMTGANAYGIAVDSEYIYSVYNNSYINRNSLYGLNSLILDTLVNGNISSTVGIALNTTYIVVSGPDTNKVGFYNKSTSTLANVFNNGGGFVDGNITTAKVNRPTGMCSDSAGNIYFTDTFNHAIRKIDTSFNMTTIAGTNTSGSIDSSNPLAARFNTPNDVFCNPAGTILYVADSNNHRIRRIDSSGVTTIGGNGNPGSLDDAVGSSTYNVPSGVCADNSGNVYVADSSNNKIRKINSSLISSTIAVLPTRPEVVRITPDYKYLLVNGAVSNYIITL